MSDLYDYLDPQDEEEEDDDDGMDTWDDGDPTYIQGDDE